MSGACATSVPSVSSALRNRLVRFPTDPGEQPTIVLVLKFDDGFLALVGRLHEPVGMIQVGLLQAFPRWELEFVCGEKTKRITPLQSAQLVTIARGGNVPSHRSLLQRPLVCAYGICTRCHLLPTLGEAALKSPVRSRFATGARSGKSEFAHRACNELTSG